MAQGTLLASAARTTTTAGPLIERSRSPAPHQGVIVYFTPTVTPNNAETMQIVMEAPDPLNPTKFATIAQEAAVLSSALGAAPSISWAIAFANFAGSDDFGTNFAAAKVVVPGVWRARFIHSGASSWTYSAYYEEV